MVGLTIDGVEVEAPAGELLIKAALQVLSRPKRG